MASATVTIRVLDADRMRLFIWELRQIHDAMRAEVCPHAERLERAIDRLTDGGDDEHEAEA